MITYVKLGEKLYHYNPHSKKTTVSTVVDVNENDIFIKLKEPIAGKTVLKLPLTHIGEWLFYDESHIRLPRKELIENVKYPAYKKATVLLEKKEFKKELSTRRIWDIVHFTKLNNLESILIHGIIPRTNHKQLDIVSQYNDIDRHDSRMDCTSCSITFPNDKVFSSFRSRYPDEKWVIIILNSDILLSEENICRFYLTNASNIYMYGYSGSDLEHFRNMFTETLNIQKLDGSSKIYSRTFLQNNLPTDSQAEILIKGNIDKKYIKKVIFDEKIVKNEWCSKHISIAENYHFETSPKYFGWRSNFIQ